MAVYTVSNAGGNYNVGTTWVGGVVPSTTDTVAFTPTSGNLTISVAATCAGIVFTNYVKTITILTSFFINGNINLGTGGYLVGGGNTMYAAATGTITSNGTAWKGNFGFYGNSQTYTLADDLTVNGTITVSVATSGTLNGFTIYVKSTYSHTSTGNLIGTTNLVFNGTGFWSHTSSGQLGLNTIINTAGTITCGANVRYNTGILTYTAGTIITTSSTLTIGGACTLDTSGMTWNNVTTAVAASITLISILIVGGTLSIGAASFVTNYCHVKGNLVVTSNTGTTGGILINGTGNQTWSGTQMVRGGFVINKPSGILTVSGSVSFSNGILTYIAGTVVTTGSTLTVPALGTLDTNGIIWNNVTFSNAATRTLLSDLTCNTFQLVGGASIVNGSSVYFNNLTYNANAGSIGTGTSTFIFKGTGTWSHSTTGRFNNNLVFDTGISGVTTFTNNTYINSGTVTRISGSVDQGAYTLTLASTCVMNTSGMTWGKVYVNGTVAFTSLFQADEISSNGFTTMAFGGTYGFEVNKFHILNPVNITVTLVNGVRYLIKQSLITNIPGFTRLFTCASGAALLDLQYGATQNVANTSATRINSLGGQTIYTTSGTLTSTQNWNVGTYRNPTNFMIMF